LHPSALTRARRLPLPTRTKLVTPPELPTEPRGRALTPKEVRHLLEDRGPPGEFTGISWVTAHDLRRTVVTKLLNDERSYREVQLVTRHRDPKTIMRYDHARENLDNSTVNTLSWDTDWSPQHSTLRSFFTAFPSIHPLAKITASRL
jgi:integrase